MAGRGNYPRTYKTTLYRMMAYALGISHPEVRQLTIGDHYLANAAMGWQMTPYRYRLAKDGANYKVWRCDCLPCDDLDCRVCSADQTCAECECQSDLLAEFIEPRFEHWMDAIEPRGPNRKMEWNPIMYVSALLPNTSQDEYLGWNLRHFTTVRNAVESLGETAPLFRPPPDGRGDIRAAGAGQHTDLSRTDDPAAASGQRAD